MLTPHDGEYALLTGAAPGADRFAAVRRLAAELGCTVLLKGPTTLVADPDGEVWWSTAATNAWRRPGQVTCWLA